MQLNCRMLFEYSSLSVLLYSDDRYLGCGAWSAHCGGLEFVQNWGIVEVSQCSTWRELKGVFLALKSFATNLRIG